jgi:fatty-acyl-CoA synthase
MVTDEAMLPWFERGIPVCQVYGLTETCPTATVVPAAQAEPKRSSAGLPVATCAVSIVDPNGDRLPRGRLGEVALSGSTVFHEYWRNPDATADAFLGPSFRTGDAGYIDDDGFLHIVERLKDIIIVGGSNVYPADIESVLAADPRIREAAVVARPDPELDEVPAAFIVGEPGLTHDHVLALFHGALAEYKHPRDVFFIKELPKSALGKVQRSVLRAWAHNAPLGARGDGDELAATAQHG